MKLKNCLSLHWFLSKGILFIICPSKNQLTIVRIADIGPVVRFEIIYINFI